MRIAKLGVVGAGTMGSGIAALAASAGFPVVLLDIPGRAATATPPRAQGSSARARREPAAFMDPPARRSSRSATLDDDLELLADCDWSSRRSSSSPARSRRCTSGSSRSSSRRDRRRRTRRASRCASSPKDAATGSSATSSARTSSIRRGTSTCSSSSPPPTPRRGCSTPRGGSARACSARGSCSPRTFPASSPTGSASTAWCARCRAMQEFGLTIDEVDALTGPLLGRAESATFRTADISGLDVLCHVVEGPERRARARTSRCRTGCEQLVASGRSARRPGRVLQEGREGDHDAGLEDARVRPAAGGAMIRRSLRCMKQPLAAAVRSPRRQLPGKYGEFVRNYLLAHVALRAEDAPRSRTTSSRRPRDGVGLRLGGGAVPADGRARPRLPARRLRARWGSTMPPLLATAQDGASSTPAPTDRRTSPSTAGYLARAAGRRARSRSSSCARARAP